MSNDNDPLKVDYLQYDWPMNVLGYESRALLGMSMQELLIVALPAVFRLMLTESLPLASSIIIRMVQGRNRSSS